MTILSSIIFLAIFAAGCAVMYREGFLKSGGYIAVSIFFLTLAFAVRIPVLDWRTGDYNDFLSVWVDYFRQNGGFAALKDSIGNYNLPYLYFLALFSYIPVDDLYLIKFLSIAFDLVLAWGVSRLVLFFTDSKPRQLAAFIAVMLMPTDVLNGALWAQCDSIFAAFAVISLYMALCGKSRSAYAFAALSLAFKVQAVFFLPLFGVLILTGVVRLRDCWVFPAVFLATLLPAVLLGHPLSDALTVYFRQVEGATYSLNLNSASIYALIPYGYDELWLDYAQYIGIALALALVYTTMFWTVARYKSVTLDTLFGFGVLLALGIPLFLPYMHERYFFLADALTLALAFAAPAYAPVFILCQFGSLLGYFAYIRGYFILPMFVGTAAMLAAFVFICLYIHKSFQTPELECPYEQ